MFDDHDDADDACVDHCDIASSWRADAAARTRTSSECQTGARAVAAAECQTLAPKARGVQCDLASLLAAVTEGEEPTEVRAGSSDTGTGHWSLALAAVVAANRESSFHPLPTAGSES